MLYTVLDSSINVICMYVETEIILKVYNLRVFNSYWGIVLRDDIAYTSKYLI
jgi:hypothetical protein